MAEIYTPNTPRGPERETVLREVHDNQMLMHGIIGGVFSGIVFAIADSIMFYALGQNFWDTIRLLGSIVLGHRAMDPAYPLAIAAGIGIALWVVLAALFGVAFIYLMSWFGQLNTSRNRLVIAGWIYGILLWLLNLHVVAPLAFPWFGLYINQFWNGFIAHSFFYGAILGFYVGSAWPWVHDQIHNYLWPSRIP